MDLQPNSISRSFDQLEDFRIERTKRHKLIDIVFISLCATLCGYEGWEEIELFAKVKADWLGKFLELPNGIPSHDTIRRVFMHLDPSAFHRCFSGWVEGLGLPLGNQVVAIDGKTIRGSRCSAKGKSAIHMVSAWACDHETVLGQIKVDDKSNEITAIPDLLETLMLEGSVVTIDAMGCQKTIARQIIDQKADYLFGLKGNQGKLREEVQDFFHTAQAQGFLQLPYSDHNEVDAGHGRIEERHCFAVSCDYIEAAHGWCGAKSVVMLNSRRWIRNELQTETRYYLSSLPPDAERIAPAIRSHWSIENSLHWCLDVGFNEDACGIYAGNAAENLSTLRHFAINLVKADKKRKGGIARKRKLAAIDDGYLETLLMGR